jgi:hypothetical protein
MLADETTDNAWKELLLYWLYVLGIPIDTDGEGKSVLREEVIAIRDGSKQIRSRLNIAVFDEVKLSGKKYRRVTLICPN